MRNRTVLSFKSVIELVSYFKDEKNCWEYLTEMRWGGHITCPKCGKDKIYKFSDGKRYKCGKCKYHFTAKVGTIFQDTKIPLMKWFIAMHFIGSNKKGLSTRQLAAEINVSQKTSWFMMHRIRESFTQAEEKLKDVVEVDETFVGGKNKNRHTDKRTKVSPDRTYQDKTPVMGMLEIDGTLRCAVIPDTKGATLKKVLYSNVEDGSIVVTDEWSGYNGIEKKYTHEVVDHLHRRYVNDSGFTTNRLEGFWAHLKRSLGGIYHRVSRKHLQRYVNESVFRYNLRLSSMCEKLNFMMGNISRVLKYKQLINEIKSQ